MKRLVIAALALVAVGVVASSALAATATKASVIYNSVVANGPPSNLPSVSLQGTSTSEFGGAVTFAAGSARSLTNATVGLSSFACATGDWYGTDSDACNTPAGATFSQPITLNIYKPDGSLITSVTQTFDIPYRPSYNSKCAIDAKHPTGWYSTALKKCFNGMTDNVTFNLSGVKLPTDSNSIVYGIAFNTTDYGAHPTHVSGPYDSLNVALSNATDVTAGDTGSVWMNSSWSGAYADGGPTGTFRADTGSWSPYVPAVQFKAGNAS